MRRALGHERDGAVGSEEYGAGLRDGEGDVCVDGVDGGSFY